LGLSVVDSRAGSQVYLAPTGVPVWSARPGL